MIQGTKIVVKQVRSSAGRTREIRRTLRALGLGRIGKERAHTVNPALLGMIGRVNSLVRIFEVN